MPLDPDSVRPVAGAHVRARGWGWRHAGRGAPAVSGLDLDIRPGERVLLLGASGAGKSTLVHALAGVLGSEDEGDETGELLVDGRRPADARGRVGLVLQDPDSQVVLARVGDDVAFGCENLAVPRDEIWRRVGAALDSVGLRLPLDHPTSALSGGQKQRLALAGVLAMRPGLLLLDEPTANLDPEGVIEVRDAVRHTLDACGATLIVIEHRVAVWQDLVDRVIVLDAAGGILADGPTGTVLQSEGERLAAAGVWVPHLPPRLPGRLPNRLPADLGLQAGGAQTPDLLLSASGLAVGRVPFARRTARVVAGGIDLTIGAGTATAITGPNGAGKSTLALTLAGLLAPAGGRLAASPGLADGLGTEPVRWRSRALLTRIGTVFQDPEHQFLSGSVRAELAVGPHALGLAPAEQVRRVDELLERLRLDHLAEANPFTLSGGEKRRLSVATVLASRPRVLVLDEPTFGQDSRTWRELVALLVEVQSAGTALVFVTHDELLVDTIADSEYRLAGGRAGSAAGSAAGARR
ncbi:MULTISPECIES: ABC transporter ATP-binding protein [unclassified Cryobacterium]|uniref:ABC transporter ATP-binding protein n=1 Tax=unclassified Cryobacterium TaxID=2649013 RepID=UPI00106981FB|nr:MULTISPECIES: ATP-binding cassette domain-containing protein [unclassified Cryobacterium]TFB96505.1 energy-coupling factor ABC transporter ATP-binding protein [Cryobacterium sp. MDB2-A-1]TFC02887.1 energy-coupling factor ABC transporter ATP-binding protein [Cryobacterium sp. MDB2-33-2]TFC12790.1 energy-coupling factor ABC transporter ATP-binding protein [Cryobacterium sp. MDB2-A-2]TFC15584.1 energy-coupling factor ABC transporter ATP-binding protein [Cryobacterium sp. MDB2-10]